MSETLKMNTALILLNKRYWLAHFLIVAAICIAGLIYLGGATYMGSPPRVDFVSPSGETVISQDQIILGQKVFHLRGLMTYGSFWGDGAERGPDFTADALHRTVVGMRNFYENELKEREGPEALTQYHRDAIAARVIREIHTNTWDEDAGNIRLNDAQINAFRELNDHYTRMFTDSKYSEAFDPAGFISDPDDIRNLTSFFFWGGWVSGANRPGETYSYTHNWPGDVAAGNTPTQATFFWSVLSIFALFLGIGAVLYVYGQMKTAPVDVFDSDDEGGSQTYLTTYDLENEYVRPTQRSTYKFFVLAIVVFGVQILGGVIAATDFVRPFGVSLNELIPFSVARSYHTLLQIFWFFMCWVGYTLFFLPRISKVPKGQKFLINVLFALCMITGVGALVGIYLGQTGMITGENPRTAGASAAEAGVDDCLAEATPEAKLARIREKQSGGRLVAMTGDGTNDAPALAQADVGVAMNSGTQAAKEAGNMVDLDSDPTKLIEIVEIGKQLLMTRGALTTFSIANDVAKYFAIIPAAFLTTYPQLKALDIIPLTSPSSAILSAVIFNALIIVFLIPLALKGVRYRAIGAALLLRRNPLIYGLGGILLPFAGIKLIDVPLTVLHLV